MTPRIVLSRVYSRHSWRRTLQFDDRDVREISIESDDASRVLPPEPRNANVSI